MKNVYIIYLEMSGPEYKKEIYDIQPSTDNFIKNDKNTLYVGIKENLFNSMVKELDICKINNWKSNYNDDDIIGGTHWKIKIGTKTKTFEYIGANKFPSGWSKFVRIIRKYVNSISE